MSLNNLQSLKPKAVIDNVVNFSPDELETEYPVIRGAATYTAQQLKPSGSDNSNGEVVWNVFSPSRNNVCMSRCVVLSATVTIDLETQGTTFVNKESFLPYLTKRLALKPFPLSSAIQSVAVDLDGQQYNVDISQWYNYMKYINYNESELREWATCTPSLLDNGAFYDNSGSTNNVLANYNDTPYDSIPPRGAFPIATILNTSGTGTAHAKLSVSYQIREAVPISPFLTTLSKQHESEGLIGWSNMKLKLTFAPNLFNRCVSVNLLEDDAASFSFNRDNSLTVPPFTATGGTGVVSPARFIAGKKSCTFTGIQGTFQFYQLSPTQIPPEVVNYPWNNITYLTDARSEVISGVAAKAVGTTLVDLAPVSKEYSLSSYQLSTIPHSVFMCCVPNYETDPMPTGGTGLTTLEPWARGTLFLPIHTINVTFGNQIVLNTVDPYTLYRMSVDNGLKWITYQNSGMGGRYILNTGSNSTGDNAQISLRIPMGSPLLLKFMTDIVTNDVATLAPGVAANTQWQARVSIYNYTAATLNVKFITVFIYEGVLSVSQSASCAYSYGILQKSDVTEADQNAGMSVSDLSDPVEYNGGASFWSKLRKFGKKAARTVNSPAFRKMLDTGLNFAEAAQIPFADEVHGAVNKAYSTIDQARGQQGSAYVAGRLLNAKQAGSAMVAGGAAMTPGRLRARLVN